MMRDLVQVSGASGPPAELIFGDWYPAMRSGKLRAGKTAKALLLGVPLLLGRRTMGRFLRCVIFVRTGEFRCRRGGSMGRR